MRVAVLISHFSTVALMDKKAENASGYFKFQWFFLNKFTATKNWTVAITVGTNLTAINAVVKESARKCNKIHRIWCLRPQTSFLGLLWNITYIEIIIVIRDKPSHRFARLCGSFTFPRMPFFFFCPFSKETSGLSKTVSSKVSGNSETVWIIC